MAKLLLTVSAGHLACPIPAAYFRGSGCSLETVMGGKSKENLKRNDAAKATPKEELRRLEDKNVTGYIYNGNAKASSQGLF